MQFNWGLFELPLFVTKILCSAKDRRLWDVRRNAVTIVSPFIITYEYFILMFVLYKCLLFWQINIRKLVVISKLKAFDKIRVLSFDDAFDCGLK